ncbi:hypothetical protein Mal4_43070 [Maioricimonas rarisocia]|uniref:Uncharacterized protein n=1 Tax=Maioricimonas rarisocia TaxID=2528026 RepID=A0A517ZBT6_9PLAN|nr:hypothetical protein [Maioricimonas rarisocia]QDU39953.1 hypothetical protein Mal4_43070 [Maioricimonas rarisocia]
MKCLSAAVIVLAGAIPFTAGPFIRHDQTQGVVTLAGAVVALYGLVVWTRLLREPDERLP